MIVRGDAELLCSNGLHALSLVVQYVADVSAGKPTVQDKQVDAHEGARLQFTMFVIPLDPG
jgi:hypothetical protein